MSTEFDSREVLCNLGSAMLLEETTVGGLNAKQGNRDKKGDGFQKGRLVSGNQRVKGGFCLQMGNCVYMLRGKSK